MPHTVLLLALVLASCASASFHDKTTPSAAERTPEQLESFLDTHERAIAAGDRTTLERLDALCGQHDCRSSRLFWFTDLEQARARARQERKPILSLRMLGELTDAQSCANSRFFRSVIYADPVIATLLREHFVLHWKQVRPVPKVTIDFGDGRTMQRTLTGNSAHYVLDADGRPLDVVPGLVSPRTFQIILENDRALFVQLARAGSQRDAALAAWHRREAERLVERWTHLLRARDLGRPGKLRDVRAALASLDAATRAVGYAQLAEQATLAPDVERRIADKFPDAWRANEQAPTKAILESPVLRGLRRIRETIGRDSIENELRHRGQIHTWFMRGQVHGRDAVTLDHRIYAELFLSPLDDPWYGLMPPEELRALDDCAVVHRGL